MGSPWGLHAVASIPYLHAAPVLLTHFKQRVRDLPQRTHAHGIHQHLKHILVVDDGLLQALEGSQ
jgi:hypothetical protein